MANYNLSDNTSESFTFSLGGLEYSFRYPTTSELRDIGVVNKELQQLADDKADQALIDAKSKESEEKFNALVTPVGHDNPISDVLEKQNIKVVRNFRQMLQKEISLE